MCTPMVDVYVWTWKLLWWILSLSTSQQPIKDCCTERESNGNNGIFSIHYETRQKLRGERERCASFVLVLLFYFAFSIIIITCLELHSHAISKLCVIWSRSFRPDESLSLACWPSTERVCIYSKHNYPIYYIRLSQLLMAFLLVNNDPSYGPLRK